MEQEIQETKWVCITKKFGYFTYGKTYIGKKIGGLLDIVNDNGDKSMPALYGSTVESNVYDSGFLYGGPKTTKIIYFIPLKEWREKQIDKLLNE